MRRLLVFGAGLAAIAALAAFILSAPRMIASDTIPTGDGDPVAGATLFHAGGCSSCHAPADATTDDERLQMAGGLALKTEFGTFIVPNISPSEVSGIGGWSNADFVNAMARGVSPDGRHYYPSFPYTSYQRMTVNDLIDLKAYMDTLPAVESEGGRHDLGFPYSVRRGLGLWKRLYLDGVAFEPDGDQSAAWNRGAYLVEGPGHCAECHTPRDGLGGLDRNRWMAGAPYPGGDGRVPNITPHRDGVGNWTDADIAYSLESGFTPDFDSLGGSMAAVVRNTARLTPDDRAAMATYLRSLAPLANDE
ncbi:MAG: cytochrome c [Pseudomonadota bacterium]